MGWWRGARGAAAAIIVLDPTQTLRRAARLLADDLGLLLDGQ
jgi:hypothetical protein